MNIMNSFESSVPPPLEEVRRIFDDIKNSNNYGCLEWFGLTINLPRVSFYRVLQSNEQKLLHIQLLRKALYKIYKNKCVIYRNYFEYCKDGHVHMHSILCYEPSYKNDVVGFMMDLDRMLRLVINRSLNVKSKINGKYDSKYMRIRKPSHVIQYLKNIEEWYRWALYITKQFRSIDMTPFIDSPRHQFD